MDINDSLDLNVFYSLLDKIDQKALIVSSEGDIVFANETFLRLYGVTEEFAQSSKIYDSSLGILTKEAFLETVALIRENKGSLHHEHKYTFEGKVKYSEWRIFSYEKDGRENYLCLAKDITELKLSQTKAEELNSMLNKIIDNLPVYLFVKDVDDDLRYLIWNKAFAEYSKIPAEKVIGRTDFEVFPQYQDALEFRNDDLKVIENGELMKKHETYIAADGTTRIVQTYKTLVNRQGRGPLLVGMSLDITDIHGIEEELVRERLRAEESDRLKTRFLANMSHEIRTPLNAIVGFSGMLPDAEDDETRQNFINIISENSELLLQLINDIIDLSKIEAGTLDYTRMPMDLYDTFLNLLLVHKERLKDGVKLIYDNESAPGKFIINEDRNRLMQVMDNLLNNAIKFTSEGEIHYGYRVNGDNIEVYVSDTGRGIPADKQEAVFDRFVKLDNFVQGSGLGLSICKVIVETLGGKMTLESEEGKGSTFGFTIPYIKDRKFNADTTAVVEEKKPVKALDGDPDKDHTILVAEDVPSNFLVVKTLIKGRFNILWAKDGKEAVEMARSHDVDLVLMDLKMPVMDGLEASRQIRTFNKEIPIVALTANAYDQDRVAARQAGMNNFLSKPINREAFETVVAAYLGLA